MSLLDSYIDFLSNGGLLPYFGQALDFLRGSLGFNAPSTSPQAPPYTPPFEGGQCNKAYSISFVQTYADGSKRYYVGNGSGGIGEVPTLTQLRNAFVTSGAISSINISGSGQTFFGRVDILINGSISYYFNNIVNDQAATSVAVYQIVTRDGSPDNCGNLPNPNPAPDIPIDGIASSAAPDLLGGANGIITGSPLPSGDFGGIAGDANDDFNEAGTLSPSDIGGAIGKIANGLAKIAQLLNLLNDVLDLLRKLLSKDNKTSFRYDYGNIKNDGFIRLYPDVSLEKIEAEYIDIKFTEIRVGIGKELGTKSPHYYKYEPLGRIMFVSPTFGVISVHELQTVRCSLPVPRLAYGFFYHLGLTGTNKADCSGYYLKLEE